MFVRCASLTYLFLVAVGIPAAAAAQAPVPLPVQFELKGVVLDVARIPIQGAEVAASSKGAMVAQVLTAKDGSFTLVALPGGPLSLHMRRLGYLPETIQIQVGLTGQAPLDIILKAAPADLNEVVINAAEMGGLAEFNEHKRQARGFAKFFDEEDIRKRGPMVSSDLFRAVTGVTVRSGNNGVNTIRIHGCQPIVWIDGQRVPDAELDEVVSPGDIAGIEFYTSMAGTPAKYVERTARPCGALLIWTKRR